MCLCQCVVAVRRCPSPVHIDTPVACALPRALCEPVLLSCSESVWISSPNSPSWPGRLRCRVFRYSTPSKKKKSKSKRPNPKGHRPRFMHSLSRGDEPLQVEASFRACCSTGTGVANAWQTGPVHRFRSCPRCRVFLREPAGAATCRCVGNCKEKTHTQVNRTSCPQLDGPACRAVAWLRMATSA